MLCSALVGKIIKTFLILLVSIFSDCGFFLNKRICLFHLNCQIYCHNIFSLPLWCLCEFYDCTFLKKSLILVVPSFFFSWAIFMGSVNFISLFKEPVFDLMGIFLFYSSSIFSYIFIISSFALNLMFFTNFLR